MTRAKADDNQPQIVAAFRQMGATVQHLHAVGQGCPDLLVGYRGRNLLVEVKDGNKPPSKRTLTEAQVAWHRDWRGSVVVVEGIDGVEALLRGVEARQSLGVIG
jgi:hypothetical protein